MQSYYSKKLFWQVIYVIWPPFLRLMELLKIHNERQDFLIGKLSPNHSKEIFIDYLQKEGFEPGICAWRDPGEILGMRKLDTPLYQYHLRLFKDGELRGHYEYSPEAKPVAHSIAKGFESRIDFFQKLLKDYLA